MEGKIQKKIDFLEDLEDLEDLDEEQMMKIFKAEGLMVKNDEEQRETIIMFEGVECK